MSYALKFLDPANYTTVRLSLDDPASIIWIDELTDIPAPENTKQWASNNQSDGATPVSDKLENIPMKLAFKITGANTAAVDTNVRALIKELCRDTNMLKVQWEGQANPLYYHTFKYDKIDPGTLQKRLYRLGKLAWGLTVDMQALPEIEGDEETITPCVNLLPNWTFEDIGAGGPPNDPVEYYELTKGAGAGAVLDTAYKVFGLASMEIWSTTTGVHATETLTDFITVDRTKHYNFLFNYLNVTGTLGKLTAGIMQYDAAGNIGTTTVITPSCAAATTWYLSSTVIHPAGAGDAIVFDADCAKIKIYWDVVGVTGGAIEVYYVDGAVFTCSEYLSINEITNALGIVLPAAALSGDVPSPCDIHINKFVDLYSNSPVKNTTAIYVGGRKEATDDYEPYMVPALVAWTTYSNLAFRGAILPQTVGAELILNNSFETFANAPGSNTEDWANWVETRGGAGYMVADPPGKQGSYQVFSYLNAMGPAATNTLVSDFTAVNIANQHFFSIWYALVQNSGLARCKVYIDCYNAASVLQGTLTVLDTFAQQTMWTPVYLSIPVANWPATTTKIKVRIEMTVGWSFGMGPSTYLVTDNILVDFCSLKEGPSVFSGGSDIGITKGAVKAFWHYKITASQAAKAISLAGKVSRAGLTVVPWYEISNPTMDMPGTWTFQGDGYIDPFNIPNLGASDDSDLDAWHQELQIKIDSALAATVISSSCIVLLPVDNGYVAVSAENNQHLIIDSRSDMPWVLASYDGTKAESFRLPNSMIDCPFTVDPINGSNFAILSIWTDPAGNQPAQFLADVTIKYRPRYLLVA